MGWAIIISVLSLLLIVLFTENKDKDIKFWLVVFGLYLLGLISFNLDTFQIPIGILIAFYFVNRRKVSSKKAKNLTLLFALIYFVLIRALHPLTFTDIKDYKMTTAQLNRFEGVKEVIYIPEDAPQQEQLRRFIAKDSHDEDLMDCEKILRTWVSDKENVEIKNIDTLLLEVQNKLKFVDSYHRANDEISEGYLSFEDGKKYFFLFKRNPKVKQFHLEMIVEYTNIKAGEERRFPF